MNDSRDFQDAESICSGNSHVTSQPVSHPIPEGMLSRSFRMSSRREGPPWIWDTWYIGNVFCKSSCASFSLPYPQELNPWSSGREEPIHSSTVEIECGTNTSSRSEMPVWTVSQKLCPPLWGRLFQELWSRPTTTADFRSSFRQIPYTSYACLLEDKFQDRGMYLFTISYGSYALDQRSGDGWFSWWFNVFVIFKRNSNIAFWSTRCEDCFSTEQRFIHKKNQSGGTTLRSRTDYTGGRQIAYLIIEYFRVTGAKDSVEKYAEPVHYWSSKWWYSGIRFKGGRNSSVHHENPIGWRLGNKLRIRVWETQDRIGIEWPEYSSVENRTWFSQIEGNGKKKYRTRFTKKNLAPETETMKETPWSMYQMRQWQFPSRFRKRAKNDTAEYFSEFFHAREWEKFVENPKSQRKKVPVMEFLDGLARITSKELAITHFVNCGTLQNACSTRRRVVANSRKSTRMHNVRLMNNLIRGPKRMMTKVQ